MPNENLGFGKANNIGICEALKNGSDYVFLLNQDAWVMPNVLSILIDTFQKNKKYGILSPLQLNANNKFDSQFKKYYKKSSFVNDTLRQCKFVNAAGWLLTKECINRVGGFSPLFFHYGEDADYCNRVIYYKYKIGVVTSTSYIHDRGKRNPNTLSHKKQINQVYINQLVRLANINRNILFLVASQYFNILKKTVNFNKEDKYISKSSFVKGVLKSQFNISKVISYRIKSKKTASYLPKC